MSHHHDHDHDHHDHHHDKESHLSFDGKIIKLLEHWIKHNADHAQTYRDWAKQATENNRDSVCALLEKAADMSVSMNKKFEKALKTMRK